MNNTERARLPADAPARVWPARSPGRPIPRAAEKPICNSSRRLGLDTGEVPSDCMRLSPMRDRPEGSLHGHTLPDNARRLLSGQSLRQSVPRGTQVATIQRAPPGRSADQRARQKPARRNFDDPRLPTFDRESKPASSTFSLARALLWGAVVAQGELATLGPDEAGVLALGL